MPGWKDARMKRFPFVAEVFCVADSHTPRAMPHTEFIKTRC